MNSGQPDPLDLGEDAANIHRGGREAEVLALGGPGAFVHHTRGAELCCEFWFLGDFAILTVLKRFGAVILAVLKRFDPNSKKVEVQ